MWFFFLEQCDFWSFIPYYSFALDMDKTPMVKKLQIKKQKWNFWMGSIYRQTHRLNIFSLYWIDSFWWSINPLSYFFISQIQSWDTQAGSRWIIFVKKSMPGVAKLYTFKLEIVAQKIVIWINQISNGCCLPAIHHIFGSCILHWEAKNIESKINVHLSQLY